MEGEMVSLVLTEKRGGKLARPLRWEWASFAVLHIWWR